MNKKSRLSDNPAEVPTQLHRVTRLLHRAQSCLPSAQGKAPTYAELEVWTGVAERTIKDWFNNHGRPTAEFLLQLLERIPDPQRQALLASACRVSPALASPRLNCDQTLISRLKSTVLQSHGLVYLQGGDDEDRTFVLTALGHAFLELTARPHTLTGLDAHEPDWFVPLPGVTYLGNLFPPRELLRAAREHWPKMAGSGAQMTVFNALGVMLGEFQRALQALTAQSLVIIADSARIKPAVLKRASRGPVQIITLSQHPDDNQRQILSLEAF